MKCPVVQLDTAFEEAEECEWACFSTDRLQIKTEFSTILIELEDAANETKHSH